MSNTVSTVRHLTAKAYKKILTLGFLVYALITSDQLNLVEMANDRGHLDLIPNKHPYLTIIPHSLTFCFLIDIKYKSSSVPHTSSCSLSSTPVSPSDSRSCSSVSAITTAIASLRASTRTFGVWCSSDAHLKWGPSLTVTVLWRNMVIALLCAMQVSMTDFTGRFDIFI